jgi:hypothetical protein
MRWVKADLGWTLEPGAAALRDSDQNESQLVSLAASVRPVSRSRFTVTGSYRDTRLNASRGSSAADGPVLRINPGNFPDR